MDGTGAPPVLADVAIAGERVVAVEPGWDGRATRTLDAEGRIVTPGFVDIHTHLDAQLAWDPLPTSSCWHEMLDDPVVVMGLADAGAHVGQIMECCEWGRSPT